MKRSFSWATAVALVATQAFNSGCGDESVLTALATTKWATVCGTNGKTIMRVEFTSETEVAVTTETYKTEGCTNLNYTLVKKYTFVTTPIGPLAQFNEASRLTLKLVTMTLTPNSDAGVTVLNTASTCSKTTWANGTTVDLFTDLTLADQATSTVANACAAYNLFRYDATTFKFKKYTVGEEIFQIVTSFSTVEEGESETTETRHLLLGALSSTGADGTTLATAPTVWDSSNVFVEVK